MRAIVRRTCRGGVALGRAVGRELGRAVDRALGCGVDRAVDRARDRRLYLTLALTLVGAVTARTAAAQGTIIQADGVVNTGFTQTTRSTFLADPNAEAGDVPQSSVSRAFLELRPSVLFQGGTPRVTWRAGYTFSGNVTLNGGDISYGNQANTALVAELSPDTLLTLTAALSQGGTLFLLSQTAAQDGRPEIRAQGNPALVTATLAEAIAWQAGRHFAVRHSFNASVSAPEDNLSEQSTAMLASFGVEQQWTRDVLGVDLRLGLAWLRPPRADLPNFASVSNALVARWNHDFSPDWNGQVIGGVEQVFMDTGSRPLAFLPTGGLTLRYAAGRTTLAADVTHGSAANLQVGAVSLADQVTLRGVFTIDERKLRALSFSAGLLHNEPIGDVAATVAAATGNAVQADAGFTTSLARNVMLVARYSAAYQFGQGAGLGSTLAHIFLVGVSGTYSNSETRPRRLPSRGDRVDASDGESFRVVPDAPSEGEPGAGGTSR